MWRGMQQRLKLRQLDLQLRSAELRVQLAQDVQSLETPLQWADRAHGVLRLMRSLPKAWKALGALGGIGGLIGLARLFGKPGRLARWWTWLTVARRIWGVFRPQGNSRQDGSEDGGQDRRSASAGGPGAKPPHGGAASASGPDSGRAR